MAEAEKHTMKKYLLLLVAIIALTAGAYFSELQFLSYSYSSAPTLTTSLAAQGDTLAARDATSTKTASIEFTLSVGGKNYHGTVRAEATVLDAMNELASSSDFKFTSKEFSGMGTFVESINGKAGADGFYWILYINGTPSQTGASQTIVNSSDIVEWKYEKGY